MTANTGRPERSLGAAMRTYVSIWRDPLSGSTCCRGRPERDPPATLACCRPALDAVVQRLRDVLRLVLRDRSGRAVQPNAIGEDAVREHDLVLVVRAHVAGARRLDILLARVAPCAQRARDVADIELFCRGRAVLGAGPQVVLVLDVLGGLRTLGGFELHHGRVDVRTVN